MVKLTHLGTFWHLAYRDLRFIFWGLPGRLVDSATIGLIQVMAISQFLPMLGMPTSMIAPLFIGTMTQIVFSSAYGIAFEYVKDLHTNRFINYQLTLPLPKVALFSLFIFIFMVEIFFISFPLTILGIVLLSSYFPLANAHWFLVITFYLLTLFFFALLFIYFAFSSGYTWFLDNIWPRRLTPLIFLGCVFYTWKKLYAFNAILGIITLCNPLTYIHEGMRSTFFGDTEFLPPAICFGAVIAFSLLLIFLLTRAVKKRLDPV